MKRLRKRAGSDVRFYMCGEYGPENWRPHYHALLFGFDFADKRYSCRTGSGESFRRISCLRCGRMGIRLLAR